MRWRVLKRLVDWHILLPLPRRVGGSLRGSARLAYALDTAGERLLRLRRNLRRDEERIRRPGTPGERFVQHTLAVTELFVQLVERSRRDGCVHIKAKRIDDESGSGGAASRVPEL
jgi:hypothetical protein